MPKSSDPMKYPPTYNILLEKTLAAQEPIERRFASLSDAQSFRFDFYAFAKALKKSLRAHDGPMSAHERLAEQSVQITISVREDRVTGEGVVTLSNRLTNRFAQILEAQGDIMQVPSFLAQPPKAADLTAQPQVMSEEFDTEPQAEMDMDQTLEAMGFGRKGNL